MEVLAKMRIMIGNGGSDPERGLDGKPTDAAQQKKTIVPLSVAAQGIVTSSFLPWDFGIGSEVYEKGRCTPANRKFS